MNDPRDRKPQPSRLDPRTRARLLSEIERLEESGEDGQVASPPAKIQARSATRQDSARPPARSPGSEAMPDRPADAGATSTRMASAQSPGQTAGDLPRIVDLWGGLGSVSVDPVVLARNLVITAARTDPAHGAFDVLRSRLLQALAEKGWRRVGITSPTKGCGKTFTAINLAIALSRYDNCRTILMDMDLRNPSLAGYLGLKVDRTMGDFLREEIPAEAILRKVGPNDLRIGANLALGLNHRAEAYAAELFQEDRTARVLERMEKDLRPDVILHDLPPALAQDDVIAFRPHMDCVLLVAGGGLTTPREMKETVRRIGEDKPVVGVILNKADGVSIAEYAY
ncbi:MAG: CpsD/CapB family tyrosine-protein kinase [Rubellimicrobium sp.]|nr:CpsD/CapB family tyrosine-protein kinase [Rubellimicrobium sp.]